MYRLVFLVAFSFLFLTTRAQVNFFGESESIKALNSPSDENYIFFDFHNSEIYFSRVKHPNNEAGVKDMGDIWSSKMDTAWSKPKNLKLNNKHFTAPAGTTPDGSYFLFHEVVFSKGMYTGSVKALTQNEKVIDVEIPYFRNKSPLQTGNLSADAKYLLLSLENSTGYGVDDLFMCELKADGTWISPKNLGSMVNTKLQEITPFLAADNKTLYFSSNGRSGAGSFDIYQSRRLDDTWQNWSQPMSMGTSVNTSGAESSFMFEAEGEYAYYVSTQNSDGYGDVRRIKIKTDIKAAVDMEVVQLKISEPKKQVEIWFSLQDKRLGTPVAGQAFIVVDGDSSNIQANAKGLVSFASDQLSEIEFKAQGYLSVRYEKELSGVKDTVLILMEPLATGNVITLDHVLFYKGTANFIEGSEKELDLVVEMMYENPDVSIFLKGHTDNVGHEMLNLHLSRERVAEVKRFLFDKGLPSERIKGEGYGGSQPVFSNETEESRRLNRRVEFEVIRN
ncbi:MAG: OOP family OmpA-OmpF porin [Marinoscillum sp.]|jgi:OOP family OmpA-OmpF porin